MPIISRKLIQVNNQRLLNIRLNRWTCFYGVDNLIKIKINDKNSRENIFRSS